jgi:cob(I)alamin adenosyltransferase
MGNRLSKIYTRTGDSGTTGLGDGSRVDKDDFRVEAYGNVDELNSAIGIVLASPELSANIVHILTQIQHDLLDLGGELSVPGYVAITEEKVKFLEENLDDLNKDLPPLKEFILPGGSTQAAFCHLARTICRRTERSVVSLYKSTPINLQSLIYLNRLSDLLFVISRYINKELGVPEPMWKHEREKR